MKDRGGQRSSEERSPSGAARAADERRRAPEQSRDELLSKYQDLFAKYQELVRRYEAQEVERSGAVSLALTAMRTSTTGLALFLDGRILAQNPRFDEMNRAVGRWRWVDEGPRSQSWETLRDLARDEVIALLERRGAAEVVNRYEHHPTGRIIDVHVERDGQDRSVAVIAHDVTERFRAERQLQAAREAVFEQERMQAVGELASGIAHDLNNALHAMSMRLSALRRLPAPLPDLARHLDCLARIVDDAAVRVGRLQDFARHRQDAPHGSVDLRAAILDAVAIGRPEIEATSQRDGRHAAIELDLGDLPPVAGVAAELRHVFLNLLLNARDAMREGGRIRVEGRVEEGQVIVTVADQGPGIPSEHLTRVFEPFFTTKAEKGTGLGLAVAYGVMRRLGGSITASNGVDRGAVFTLVFPVAHLEPAEEPAAGPAPAVEPGRRVLVVDDDDDNLAAMRLILEDLGQEVTTAKSGVEAVAIHRTGERFDLVLCDLGMPGMNGWQTAREIRAIVPDERIHLLTGWAQEISPDDPLRALVDGVQEKPLPMARLEELLARR